MDGVSEGVGECVGEAVGVGVSVGSVGNGVQSPTRKQFGAGDEARKRSRFPSLAASAMIAGFKPPKTGPSQFHAPYSALMFERASPSTIEEPNIIANWPQAKIKIKINNAASSIAIARRWFSPLSCSSSELRWTFSIISHLCFALQLPSRMSKQCSTGYPPSPTTTTASSATDWAASLFIPMRNQ